MIPTMFIEDVSLYGARRRFLIRGEAEYSAAVRLVANLPDDFRIVRRENGRTVVVYQYGK